MNHLSLTLALFGRSGKMGTRIEALAMRDFGFTVVHRGAPCDVAIDFSSKEGLHAHLAIAQSAAHPLVIGTTGFGEKEMSAMKHAAKTIPLLYSPNFSYGMTLFQQLASSLAHTLSNARIAIVETHHMQKKDAPSGTALMLAEILAQASKQSNQAIPIQSMRIGEVIGEHSVLFECGNERIEIKHTVHNRDAFARGALIAAKWLVGKPAGFYTFEDCVEGVYEKCTSERFLDR